ncbi:MAG TPA: PQQ-dependent sugar dehydrogenase [Candidatus Deferrimicrobiaceae bacterium]|nr:PQQ-dependent sugar dehydrogenase [Candidatus Deferrimicrobiaceae bacterium]
MQARNRKQDIDKTSRTGFPHPLTFLLCAGLALGCGGSGGGQTVEIPPPAQNLQVTLVEAGTGFALPVQVTHAGDGSGRVFVVEQAGTIRTLDNSAALPFLDIRDRVLSGGEQGLLSVAFPPGFAATRRFYVNYTRIQDGATVVSRFLVNSDSRAADNGSETVLLTIAQPFSNHNGGQLAFGPDGYLYIGMGDGGSGGDPFNNAQNPASLLGKILRIDVESGQAPYAVPASNPFLSDNTARGEIWATGLRNPWRFSFDRATGDLYIGDVGQGQFEEIDFQPSASPGGENYGWNVMEGAHCFLGPSCDNTGLVLPVAEYDHGLGCSVSGGMVYRGAEFPSFQGTYVYGDFCTGRIWGLRKVGTTWENTLLADTTHQISAFGEDEAGNLYVASYGTGTVYRIAPM